MSPKAPLSLSGPLTDTGGPGAPSTSDIWQGCPPWQVVSCLRLNGLDGVRVDIAMMRTPDGHGRLELTKFHSPKVVSAEPENALGNTLGLRSIMFAVDDLDATAAGLRAHGAQLVGEVAQFREGYRLCYVRGPAGIIVALAEQLG